MNIQVDITLYPQYNKIKHKNVVRHHLGNQNLANKFMIIFQI